MYLCIYVFMHILISAVKKLLVPLVYASIALAAADAALGDAHLKRVRSFLISTVKNTLRVMMLLFGAVGFVDDFVKFVKKQNKGLRYRIFGAIQRGEIDGFRDTGRMEGIKKYSDADDSNE